MVASATAPLVLSWTDCEASVFAKPTTWSMSTIAVLSGVRRSISISSPSELVGHGRLHDAEAGDLHPDHVSGLQEDRRVLECSASRRGAGHDDISRRELDDLAEVRDQMRDVDDHLATAALLPKLAVDPAAKRQLVRVRDL